MYLHADSFMRSLTLVLAATYGLMACEGAQAPAVADTGTADPGATTGALDSDSATDLGAAGETGGGQPELPAADGALPTPDSGATDVAPDNGTADTTEVSSADVTVQPTPGGPATPCATSADCAKGTVCSPDQNACVPCNAAADCASGHACLLHACVPAALCKSDKDCITSGKVCLASAGFCVDCKSSADCADSMACVANSCVAPNPCKSSKDCKYAVCDQAVGQCVGCMVDADCDANQHCLSGPKVCANDLCGAGACASNALFACNANGSGYAAAKACKDDDVCTVDACAGGACSFAKDPTACDDNQECTTDSCDAKVGCVHAATGVACNDGDACTTGDLCTTKGCKGAPANCGDSNPCTSEFCDPKTGCAALPLDGTTCNADDNPCTVDDLCTAGTCKPGKPKECTSANPCLVAACQVASGQCTTKPATGGCNDGTACTDSDTCDGAGSCAGNAKSCDDANLCTSDSCDAKAGCKHDKLDDKPCNADDSACTPLDGCKAGVCVAGPAKVCAGQGPCVTVSCAAKTGNCAFAPKTGGCDDGDACTGGETCKDGLCAGGVAKACDDKNPCTKDSCDSKGECVFAAANGACDDDNPCTIEDACAAGSCSGKPANAAALCDDKNPCTVDACSPLAGCAHPAKVGAACDDGNACSLGDNCGNDGKCTAGATNVCTCTGDADCAKTTNGNACLGVAVCEKSASGSQCAIKPGTAVMCDTSKDGTCSATACIPASGKCESTPKNAGGPCDDGSACSSGDACAAGLCAGKAVACDDGKPCTVDGCDPKSGCTAGPVATGPCDDGNACTEKDVCANGACAGVQQSCDDKNVCTVDGCAAQQGCVHGPTTGACDDGDPCTANDACKDTACKGVATASCDDGNPCTKDTCGAKGCESTPLVDGEVCGTGKMCKLGQCVKSCVQAANCGSTCACTKGFCTVPEFTADGSLPFKTGWRHFYHPFLDEYWEASEYGGPNVAMTFTRVKPDGTTVGAFTMAKVFGNNTASIVRTMQGDPASPHWFWVSSDIPGTGGPVVARMTEPGGTYVWAITLSGLSSMNTVALDGDKLYVIAALATSGTQNQIIVLEAATGKKLTSNALKAKLDFLEPAFLFDGEMFIAGSGAIHRISLPGFGLVSTKPVTYKDSMTLRKGRLCVANSAGSSACMWLFKGCD